MIKDYASLRAAIAGALKRDDLVDDIPYFIQEAEQDMNRLRVRHAESTLSATMSSGVIAVPSDYLELKFAYIDASTTTVLRRTSQEDLFRMFPTRAATSTPKYIARVGSNFEFGPFPDSDYSISGIYYAKPAALDADTDTNWAITHYPTFMLYSALTMAEPWLMNDERAMTWAQMAQAQRQRLENEEKRESMSGSKMRARSA